MRKNTEKRAAIACAMIVGLILLAYLVVFLFAVLTTDEAILAVMGIACVYGAIIIAVIIGIFAALRQRLKEIDKGELEEAKKY